MSIVVAPTIAEIRDVVRGARASGASVSLVPTMGALHEGHLALVARARASSDLVVVSIFVNPLQFGPGEDLDRYPRTFDADVALLGAAGADAVFAPSGAEMYPNGEPATRVVGGTIAARYEGASRPGHFDGMLTVVAKLLHIVAPDRAVFGRKDAQQAFLVTRMVADLDLPVTVDVVDTVREDDGVARSSRNRYLDPDQRLAARALPRALEAAARSAHDGRAAALAAAHTEIDGERAMRLDYLEVVDPASFEPVGAGYEGPALILVAARLGTTRLIDNAPIRVG